MKKLRRVTKSLVCFLDEHYSEEATLIGGYIVSKLELVNLDAEIAKVKSMFGLSEIDPIKWNLLDDKNYRITKGKVCNRVDDLRHEMFKIAKRVPLSIIMSRVWKGDPSYTEESWKWSFANILQRLCITLDQLRKTGDLNYYPALDVVFDWLPRQKKLDEYFDVYQEAYYQGYEFEKNTLPPLKTFGACPCLLVTRTKYSLALQLTDFFVGATADFFSWCYTGERLQSVKQHFCYLYPAFRTDPQNNKVIGYGLIIKKESPGKIEEKLQEQDLLP